MHTRKMAPFALFLVVFLIDSLRLSSGQPAPAGPLSDVTKFGAVGNGAIDDSPAFLKAWTAVCGTGGTLLIPKGKSFLLHHVLFQGPCKAKSIRVQVMGNLVAPKSTNWGNCKDESWITFSEVSGLIVEGSGTFNGQGSVWWDKFNSNALGSCRRPTALRFEKCTNLKVSGLTHLDSARNHITIYGCTGVEISNLNLVAPDLSPNTDGIDISSSKLVNIHDTKIGTGDDCVAINDGCSDITVTNVACGPGHGISIGSLGDAGGVETVERVHVRGCTFTGTTNGARIKTTMGGSGFARGIIYEQITLNNVKNPIIIDQTYVDKGKAGKGNAKATNAGNGKSDKKFISKQASGIDVSDVTFSGFKGTSSNEDAITLRCAGGKGCTNIKLNAISITSGVSGQNVQAICENVHGTATATTPAVPCLGGGLGKPKTVAT